MTRTQGWSLSVLVNVLALGALMLYVNHIERVAGAPVERAGVVRVVQLGTAGQPHGRFGYSL